MRVVCILLKDAKDLKLVADICLHFSPQIALGHRWLFIEVGACKRLYTEESLLYRLHAVLKRMTVDGKIEIGNDMPTALSMAMYGIKKKEHLPIDALPFYFDPFKLNPIFARTVDIFKQLGVTDLKKLMEIPPGLLTSKFNKDLSLALRQIHEAKNLYWPRYIPEEPIEEFFEFTETQTISNLEPLMFVSKGLVDRVLMRLRGQGFLLAKFEIILEQEKYSTVKEVLRSQTIELAFPNNSSVNLLKIISERLEKELTTRPLESNVNRVLLKVLEKVPGGDSQKDFFSKKEEDREAMHSLISVLKDKLTDQRVFYAEAVESYTPEKSWRKTLSEPSSLQPKTIAARPLRVLKKPLPLGRVDDYLICKDHRWKIESIGMLERLAGEWWMNESSRDYMRIKTASGEELWIFTQDQTDHLYLHGIYD